MRLNAESSLHDSEQEVQPRVVCELCTTQTGEDTNHRVGQAISGALEFALNHMKPRASILYVPSVYPLKLSSQMIRVDVCYWEQTHQSSMVCLSLGQVTEHICVWILCKSVRINCSAEGSKSRSHPNCPMTSRCSHCCVFFPFQSAGVIQISGGLHAVCVCGRVLARLWKHSDILLSLIDTLYF